MDRFLKLFRPGNIVPGITKLQTSIIWMLSILSLFLLNREPSVVPTLSFPQAKTEKNFIKCMAKELDEDKVQKLPLFVEISSFSEDLVFLPRVIETVLAPQSYSQLQKLKLLYPGLLGLPPPHSYSV